MMHFMSGRLLMGDEDELAPPRRRRAADRDAVVAPANAPATEKLDERLGALADERRPPSSAVARGDGCSGGGDASSGSGK